MRGIIFDCDGVLVDSEKWSCGAWLPVLARYDIAAELADIEAFIGQSDRAVLDHFRRRSGKDLPDDLIAVKEEQYFDLARDHLETFAGLRTVLEEAKKRCLHLAVASSGRQRKIRFSLEKVDLLDFFPVICSATEVERGKPAPDLFLHTAARMGLPPQQCAVVEDSVFGIQASLSAAMTPLAFTSSHPATTLQATGARHIFSVYGEFFDLFDGLS